jgi:hypothetical protein
VPTENGNTFFYGDYTKKEKKIHHHGASPTPIIFLLSNHPIFSLVPTFTLIHTHKKRKHSTRKHIFFLPFTFSSREDAMVFLSNNL